MKSFAHLEARYLVPYHDVAHADRIVLYARPGNTEWPRMPAAMRVMTARRESRARPTIRKIGTIKCVDRPGVR
jgi:hypothetical protein